MIPISNSRAVWSRWLDAVGGFFYPNVCQICEDRRATADKGYVCSECWCRPGHIRFIQPPFCNRCGLPYDGDIPGEFECGNCADLDLRFRQARAAVVANPFLLDILHRYKYGRALYFEAFLADLLLRQALPEVRAKDWDMIVPVPLHPVKLREREFNQAERLARTLSTGTRIPLRSDVLRRRLATPSQTDLTRRQRAENVKRAFAARQSDALVGARILLFDDTLTTGSTTSGCARALMDAGAADIAVWTLARGLLTS